MFAKHSTMQISFEMNLLLKSS